MYYFLPSLAAVYIVTLTSVRSASVPQNIAARVGQNVELTIDTPLSSYVNWLEYITVASGATIYGNGGKVYTGPSSISDRYTLTTVTVASTVTHKFGINSIVSADGGKYSGKNLYTSVIGYAQLIVLAADIQCSVSPDPVDAGSTLTTLCSIAYEGKWAPVMTCSSSDLTASATSDISTSNLAKISYTGTATGGSTSGSLSCEAHFENPASPSEVGTNEADNIPSYTSTWSGTFGVYTAASTITITPVQSEFNVNDVITCLATGGNPSPSYEWYDVGRSTTLVSTSQLTVTTDMEGLSHNLKCTATTTIGGVANELTETLSFSVSSSSSGGGVTDSGGVTDGNNKSGTSTTTIIIISVPTVFGVLAAVAVALGVVFGLKKGKANQQLHTNGSPDSIRKNTVTPSDISPNQYAASQK